jgi:ketosteroid isomerase-like protein
LPVGERDGKSLAAWLGVCGALFAIFCGTAMAQPPKPAENAIRGALTRWMANFNAERVDRVCNLFGKELRYDYREFPERGYQDICDVLHHSLTDPKRRFSYALDIKEIMVERDLAVVRLVWTLSVTSRDASAPPARSREYGMDVFRKQRDGSWRIIRFIAYEAP